MVCSLCSALRQLLSYPVSVHQFSVSVRFLAKTVGRRYPAAIGPGLADFGAQAGLAVLMAMT